MGLDSEKRLFLRKDAERCEKRYLNEKESFMVLYKLVISDSTIAPASHNTIIRISEIFNVDKRCDGLVTWHL